MNGIARSIGWPAAKYLPYAFWRAWFLVMYSSPLWLMFALPETDNPGLQMHYLSTGCFVVVSVLLAVFHEKSVKLLSSRLLMIGFGVAASLGTALVFAALAKGGGSDSALFVLGAALTGLGTAPIAIRAGQIYAAARVPVAITATLLCDVAAGLVFFFFVGTWAFLGVFVAVGLPLLAALTLAATGLTGNDAEADGASDETASEADAPRCPTSPVAPTRPFVYFLIAAFLIGAVAFLQNSLGNSWFSQTSIDAGQTLGVSLLILVSFALAVVFAYVQHVRLERLYRPIILFLSACVLFVYLVSFGGPAGIGATFLVYCLFSSYIWVLMAYLAQGCYFSPVQVFGYGRAVYAGGSLMGGLVGVFLLPSMDAASAIPAIAVAMVAILLLCAVAIRPQDLAAILVEEGEGSASGVPSRFGAAAHTGGASASHAEGRDVVEGVRDDQPDGTALLLDVSRSGMPTTEGNVGSVHLSPREREVYVLMRDGRDAAYIADSLCVSRNTAKTHIRNIYAKFGVHTRQGFIDVMKGL